MSVKQGGNTIAGASTVDQTYDGTSTNAQSGTAVAGAIANMVTTTNEVQSIANTKTFNEKLSISKDSQHCEVVMNSDVAKGSNPTAAEYFEILAQDDDTSTVATSHRLGDVYTLRDTAGLVKTGIRAWQNVANSMASEQISVSVASNGTINTNAPAVTNTGGIVTQTGMSAGTDGYLKFGNGYILHWCYATNVAPGSEVSFPTPFSSTNYSVVTCARYNGATGAYATGTYSESSTSFKVSKASSGNGYFKWVAFGK